MTLHLEKVTLDLSKVSGGAHPTPHLSPRLGPLSEGSLREPSLWNLQLGIKSGYVSRSLDPGSLWGLKPSQPAPQVWTKTAGSINNGGGMWVQCVQRSRLEEDTCARRLQTDAAAAAYRCRNRQNPKRVFNLQLFHTELKNNIPCF